MKYPRFCQAQAAPVSQKSTGYQAAWTPVLQALKASAKLEGPAKLGRLLVFGALNQSVQWWDAKQPASLPPWRFLYRLISLQTIRPLKADL